MLIMLIKSEKDKKKLIENLSLGRVDKSYKMTLYICI